MENRTTFPRKFPLALTLVLWCCCSVAGDSPGADVSVHDTGLQSSEGSQGRKCESRSMTLDSGVVRYAFRYRTCSDPTKPDQRVWEEGYFGMPEPSVTNWYHSGFMSILINGKDVGTCSLKDMRVIEKGPRGTFQMIWDHPEATVQLRIMLPAKANHVLADLTWTPKAGASINAVALRLVCYPSFFTSWHKRKGDRHCATPRIDEQEPKALDLVPDKDTYLYYYDTIFDVAKGEGDGPCAMMFNPEAIQSGRASIGDYAVITDLAVKPSAKRVRLAFYDFNQKKNAEADTYLKAHGAEDQKQLMEMDFRPESVSRLDFARLKSEADGYLKSAGDDAKPYRPTVDAIFSKIGDLKGKADAGDWTAEAELTTVLAEYETLSWKLKILALLNE